MNHVLIVDASASDSRIMTNLFVKAGYDPVVTESIDSGKDEAAKMPPGMVVVTAMRLKDGTAIEFIDWLKIVGLRHHTANNIPPQRNIIVFDEFFLRCATKAASR